MRREPDPGRRVDVPVPGQLPDQVRRREPPERLVEVVGADERLVHGIDAAQQLPQQRRVVGIASEDGAEHVIVESAAWACVERSRPVSQGVARPAVASTHGIPSRSMDRTRAWVDARLMRLAMIGCAPGDDESTRLRKSALVLATTSITVMSTAWVLIYLAFDRPAAAALPLTYQVCSIIGLAWFARHHRLRPFGLSQIALILTLPFLLQWSLGGFTNSGAVMIWAFAAPMAAMVFVSARSHG